MCGKRECQKISQELAAVEYHRASALLIWALGEIKGEDRSRHHGGGGTREVGLGLRNWEVGGRTGRSCCACLDTMNDRQGWHGFVVAARQDRLSRLVQQLRSCGALTEECRNNNEKTETPG